MKHVNLKIVMAFAIGIILSLVGVKEIAEIFAIICAALIGLSFNKSFRKKSIREHYTNDLIFGKTPEGTIIYCDEKLYPGLKSGVLEKHQDKEALRRYFTK